MPAPATSAPVSTPCDWEGDPLEPELDDLAYQHAPRDPVRPGDHCDWNDDSVVPELDDLAYQHVPKPKPSVPEIKAPASTPFEPPAALEEAVPMTVPDFPVVVSPESVPTQEPEDHHLAPLIDSHPPPVQPTTPPPQLKAIHPVPEVLSRNQLEKQLKEAKRKARELKKRAKKELREKHRAERRTERKIRHEQKQKAREKRRRERQNSRGDGPVVVTSAAAPLQEVEAGPSQPPPRPRDESTEEAESKFPSGWQGLPTLNDLKIGFRNLLPKHASVSETKGGSMAEDQLCETHQLRKDVQDLNKRLNEDLKENRHHSNQGTDGAADPRHISDDGRSAPGYSKKITPSSKISKTSTQDQVAQQDVHPDLTTRTCECCHAGNVRRSKSPLIDHDNRSNSIMIDVKKGQPGRLKRASCLCSVMPPVPSE
ncbi:hypothetical protein BKA67DRAFT_653605 [Truncatella angustata]|uniref:Uncharacterized protein n=1 Tax=Truncatella angustata TaxID=152316 RepID=A0A9P9A4M0_9PEZI|nr:uncharacterized protein BKA67DRAFT_653605 [Truncatella angustata]KAH6660425.1 hypothetical protein BKA67DRAFT_653605 [Truncatella angustata]